MDKLKAIQFLSAAQSGSSSAAARQQASRRCRPSPSWSTRSKPNSAPHCSSAAVADCSSPPTAHSTLRPARHCWRSCRRLTTDCGRRGSVPRHAGGGRHAVPASALHRASVARVPCQLSGSDPRSPYRVALLRNWPRKTATQLLLHGWFEAGAWVPRVASDGAGHRRHAGLLEAPELSSPPARPRQTQLPELPEPYGKLPISGVTGRWGRKVTSSKRWLCGLAEFQSPRQLAGTGPWTNGGVMRIAPATVQADLASAAARCRAARLGDDGSAAAGVVLRPELRRTLRLRVFADFAAALCTELSQLTDAKGRPVSTVARPGTKATADALPAG